MGLDRREALKRTALLMGGALSAPSILGIMQGCTAIPEPDWMPTFFTQEQALTVMEMADTIIPTTDTAGARLVGVPSFIEQMVSKVYNLADREKFVVDLNEFMTNCESTRGEQFYDLSEAERYELLNAKNEEIKEARNKSEKPFFWKFKELTMLGYFTSEVGATQVLQYELVPGKYEPCIPLQDAGEGRTWATY